jgi:hypothetical protein
MKIKNKFIKNNWDIILAYVLPVIIIIITFGSISSCYEFSCIGNIIFGFMTSFLLTIIFSGIALFRNIRNKKLKKSLIRWIFTIIPLVVAISGLIYLNFGTLM